MRPELHRRTGALRSVHVMTCGGCEAVLIAVTALAQRGLSLAQSLLRAQLGQRVNVMILEKALTLDIVQFEDSEFYDKLTRARREASSRPLSLVMRTFGLLQNAISLVSFGGLLVRFSPWAVVLLVLAGLPAFLAEAKFSGEAFRLFRWRAPESRMQIYLESVLARDENAKEVKLFELGPRFLDRYRDIFTRLYQEDRDLTVRRDTWGFGLGLLGHRRAVRRLRLDRRGDGARRDDGGTDDHVPHAAAAGTVGGERGAHRPISGLYEDNLYLSNLFEYLEQPVRQPERRSRSAGPQPGDGIRFEDVDFVYPGADAAGARGHRSARAARTEPRAGRARTARARPR